MSDEIVGIMQDFLARILRRKFSLTSFHFSPSNSLFYDTSTPHVLYFYNPKFSAFLFFILHHFSSWRYNNTLKLFSPPAKRNFESRFFSPPPHPDRPFHSFTPTKSEDRRILFSLGKQCSEFRSSKVVKGSVVFFSTRATVGKKCVISVNNYSWRF